MTTLEDGTRVRCRLPPELIQRIVRAQFGVLRNCYEAGLARNPKLEGRVATRFVIGRDGKVSQVSPLPLGASESAKSADAMPDPEVLRCIVAVFSALEFPPPEGGIVTVTYPIVFAVEDSQSPPPRRGARRLQVELPTITH
jgi:hypothetical protein